jgi:hypothetical protein
MGTVRSCFPSTSAFPRLVGGSAPASPVSGPAQRSLSLRPTNSPSRQSDPLPQRLQQLRHLHYCSDCYRVERTSSRAGFPPHWGPAPFHGARRTWARGVDVLQRAELKLRALHSVEVLPVPIIRFSPPVRVFQVSECVQACETQEFWSPFACSARATIGSLHKSTQPRIAPGKVPLRRQTLPPGRAAAGTSACTPAVCWATIPL